MKITFPGTGSAVNTEDIGASILIDDRILIDAPGGIPQVIRKFRKDLKKLDTIILTHLHGDHVFGLPFLLLEYIIEPRETPIYILAPSGAEDLFTRLIKLAFPDLDIEALSASAKPVFIEASDQMERNVTDISCKLHRVPHGEIETYGVEIREPGKKKIFYAPDVSYGSELIGILESIEIAILDATTPDEPIKGHMSMRQVNDLARRFLNKVFILTHRSRYDIPPASYSLQDNVSTPSPGDTLFF